MRHYDSDIADDMDQDTYDKQRSESLDRYIQMAATQMKPALVRLNDMAKALEHDPYDQKAADAMTLQVSNLFYNTLSLSAALAKKSRQPERYKALAKPFNEVGSICRVLLGETIGMKPDRWLTRPRHSPDNLYLLQEQTMPHYLDGTEAKAGDLVIGETYNMPGRTVGIVHSIKEGETCNCQVQSLFRLIESGTARTVIPASGSDHAELKALTRIV